MEEAAFTKELFNKINKSSLKNCHEEFTDNNINIDYIADSEPLNFNELSNENFIFISQTFVCFKKLFKYFSII